MCVFAKSHSIATIDTTRVRVSNTNPYLATIFYQLFTKLLFYHCDKPVGFCATYHPFSVCGFNKNAFVFVSRILFKISQLCIIEITSVSK